MRELTIRRKGVRWLVVFVAVAIFVTGGLAALNRTRTDIANAAPVEQIVVNTDTKCKLNFLQWKSDLVEVNGMWYETFGSWNALANVACGEEKFPMSGEGSPTSIIFDGKEVALSDLLTGTKNNAGHGHKNDFTVYTTKTTGFFVHFDVDAKEVTIKKIAVGANKVINSNKIGGYLDCENVLSTLHNVNGVLYQTIDNGTYDAFDKYYDKVDVPLDGSVDKVVFDGKTVVVENLVKGRHGSRSSFLVYTSKTTGFVMHFDDANNKIVILKVAAIPRDECIAQDKTGPVVKVSTPKYDDVVKNGCENCASQIISGTVSDDYSGVDRVEVYLRKVKENGKLGDRGTKFSAVINADGTWSLSIDTSILAGGKWGFDVEAYDKAGNKSNQLNWGGGGGNGFIVDNTAPVVSVINPNKYHITYGETYVEKGYVAIDARDGDITDRVEITYRYNNNGNWEAKPAVDTTLVGEWTVWYHATDSACNKSNRGTRAFIVDAKITTTDPGGDEDDNNNNNNNGNNNNNDNNNDNTGATGGGNTGSTGTTGDGNQVSNLTPITPIRRANNPTVDNNTVVDVAENTADDGVVTAATTLTSNDSDYNYKPSSEDNGEVLGAQDAKSWSLLNLLLAVGTALMSVVLLLAFLGKDDKDSDRHGALRALTLLPAVGAVVAFLLTEDWALPIGLVDSWTILMVAIVVAQVVLTALATRHSQNDNA